MRKVLSLSLQPKTITKIKKNANSKGFDSISGYINHLVSLDDDLISDKELLTAAKEADREYKSRKTFQASSIEDLLKKYADK